MNTAAKLLTAMQRNPWTGTSTTSGPSQGSKGWIGGARKAVTASSCETTLKPWPCQHTVLSIKPIYIQKFIELIDET